jgi:perosamine synthetase
MRPHFEGAAAADRIRPRIGRVLPPAAAPLTLGDLARGLLGCCRNRGELARFAKDLRDYHEADGCFPVSSGKAALLLLLEAYSRLSPRRRLVLIPAYTCYSVPAAIVRAGLRVRLCDIDPETLDFDYRCLEKILKAERSDLLCLLPTHLFGLPADVARLRQFAGEIPIIEDAAQALGGIWRGQKAGAMGDAAFFSLGRGKAITAVEGGIIVTRRREISAQLRLLAAELPAPGRFGVARLQLLALAMRFFIHPRLFWIPSLLPFLRLGETIYDPLFEIRQLSAFQAGLARNWRQRLAEANRARTERINRYRSLLPPELFPVSSHRESSCLRLPVLIRDPSRRQEVLRQSRVLGLGIMPGYPRALSQLEQLRGSAAIAVPKAEAMARELLTLPVHGLVSAKDQEMIAGLLNRGGR